MMMRLLSKFGMFLLRNSPSTLLLLMMVFPNFAAAETRMPYSALQKIERFCKWGECQHIVIYQANITDDGYPDFAVYLTGGLSCGNRGCPVIFSFSEDGEYRTIDQGLVIYIGSIEWQQSNGQSSPASFMIEMGQDCKPLWVWTGARFDYSQCVSDKMIGDKDE